MRVPGVRRGRRRHRTGSATIARSRESASSIGRSRGSSLRGVVRRGVAADAPAVGRPRRALPKLRTSSSISSTQVARQLVDVDPGAAVDLRRELVRQDERAHAPSLPAPLRGPHELPALRASLRGCARSRRGRTACDDRRPRSDLGLPLGMAAVHTSTGDVARAPIARSSRARSPPRPSGGRRRGSRGRGTRSATARSTRRAARSRRGPPASRRRRGAASASTVVLDGEQDRPRHAEPRVAPAPSSLVASVPDHRDLRHAVAPHATARARRPRCGTGASVTLVPGCSVGHRFHGSGDVGQAAAGLRILPCSILGAPMRHRPPPPPRPPSSACPSSA